MATAKSFLSTTFFLLLSLLLHLGCFMFASQNSSSKKRKISPTEPNPDPHRPKPIHKISSSWIKKLFSLNTHLKKLCHINAETIITTPPPPPPPSTSPTVVSSRSSTLSDTILTTPSRKRRNLSISDISLDHHSFPLRNDIFPCPTCGEIFHKTHLLETHQSVKHAVSELHDGDSGKNIVKIIFQSSWSNTEKLAFAPTIHRILKIHNGPKILAKFEEYREFVKAKARALGKKDERCIADGNELLRFHCTTFICNLGQNGNSSICCQNYCSVCGIIRVGFSGKMDGISTMSSSWKAHLAVGEDLEEEFAFMNVKRIMLICRVVAGRVGGEKENDESGFDSVVGRGVVIGGGTYSRSEEDELLVFNPRAVLPCFAIVYSV